MPLSDAEITAAENIPRSAANRPPETPPPASVDEQRSIYDELDPLTCPECRRIADEARRAGLPLPEPATLLAGAWSMTPAQKTLFPGAPWGSVLEVRCAEHDWWHRVDTRVFADTDEEAARLRVKLTETERVLAETERVLAEVRESADALAREHDQLLRAYEETAAARIPGEPVAERHRPPHDAGASVGPGGCVGGRRHHDDRAERESRTESHAHRADAWTWLEEAVRGLAASGTFTKGADYVGSAFARYAEGVEREKVSASAIDRIDRERKESVAQLRGVILAMGGAAVTADVPSFVPVASSSLVALREVAARLDVLDAQQRTVLAYAVRVDGAFARADVDEAISFIKECAGGDASPPADGAPRPGNAAEAPAADHDDPLPPASEGDARPPSASRTDAARSDDPPAASPYDQALGALKALDATSLDKLSRLIPSIRKVATPPRITERYVVRHLVTDKATDKLENETARFDTFLDATAHVRALFPSAVIQPAPRAAREDCGPIPIPVSHVWRSPDHRAAAPDDPIIAINGPIPVVQ